jgi:hypothetical protein
MICALVQDFCGSGQILRVTTAIVRRGEIARERRDDVSREQITLHLRSSRCIRSTQGAPAVVVAEEQRGAGIKRKTIASGTATMATSCVSWQFEPINHHRRPSDAVWSRQET